MNLQDIPAVLNGLLSHAEPDCAGEWHIERLPCPVEPGRPEPKRFLLECDRCAIGHIFDVHPKRPPVQVRTPLRLVRS